MYLIGETIADQRSSILNETDVIHRFDTLIIDACEREGLFSERNFSLKIFRERKYPFYLKLPVKIIINITWMFYLRYSFYLQY